MSSTQDILELSSDALSLHSHDSLKECCLKLERIREKFVDVEREKLDCKIIWNLCGIIQREISKWREAHRPSLPGIEVTSQALFCLRNAFVNSPRIQVMVAETDGLRDAIIACVKWVFVTNPGTLDGSEESVQDNQQLENECDDMQFHRLAKATVTCLGNLVAANTTTRKLMWPHLLSLIRPLLTYAKEDICYLSCMVIFNCLLEEDLKKELCSCDIADEVISDLLTLYLASESSNEQTSCFTLYALEMLLCCDDMVNTIWSKVLEKQQLLLLDILSNILEEKAGSKCGSPSPSAVTFLINVFKNEADKILRTLANSLEDSGALVMARLLSFACSLAASSYWGPTLREDKSLLITVVSLLQCMNDIGSVGDNEFSRLRLGDVADDQMAKVENHPAYGFKRDLIRLIASLVYRHRTNQDQVRELGGLTLILESSQFDARNPGIKEVSIYAIRNLLEGNLENQQIVKDLEFKGSAGNQGMQLTQVNGMTVVHSATSPSPNEEDL